MDSHKIVTVRVLAGDLRVVVYADNTFEVPCMACDEPMLLGPDDHFNVVQNVEGVVMAILCAGCAKKAKKKLEGG